MKKLVVETAKLDNIAVRYASESAMFKLTRQEQLIVAFFLSALLLGTVVREWRARHPKPAPAEKMEIRIR
jgi:uncharacterized membrane protein (UPF0136 family)